ncbi:MAG: bifunctional methionine sulfoxide reductase B/A protein [Gammaproteobacteria bacterium]|nr:bifunctional methionine sulfoxide reductase B/A protein [Gammaproteobacteria bacterium]
MYLDKLASLTPVTRQIICDQSTEPPFTGGYPKPSNTGTYLCRRCGLALFRADAQFDSGCGWPSFDVALDSVQQHPDSDGIRTELSCVRCKGHLGHVFTGEGFTAKNQRYCINAASLDFVVDSMVLDTQEVIVAGGCFWGVDYFLHQLPGVLKVEVGYTGGHVLHPSYEQVCTGTTGHYEAVRVVYDVNQLDDATVLKRFFEIHDPTQAAGQGPDRGAQYQSVVFYYTDAQLNTAKELIRQLVEGGYDVKTKLLAVQTFWVAEVDHQQYYVHHGSMPYCHRFERRFKIS